MTQLPNNFFAVVVPEGAFDFSIYQPKFITVIKFFTSKLRKFKGYGDCIKIEKGSYEIVSLASEITEEQALKIVEHRYEYGYKGHGGVLICKDYATGDALSTALESFRSLLKSHSLNEATTLIIKQVK